MRNVVPFRSSATFEKFGIDWTKDAATERERNLREALLSYERSCGPNGLASLVLLATVSRRQGAVAQDLQDAADFAEIILAMKLRKHQDDVLELVHAHIVNAEVHRSESHVRHPPLSRHDVARRRTRNHRSTLAQEAISIRCEAAPLNSRRNDDELSEYLPSSSDPVASE